VGNYASKKGFTIEEINLRRERLAASMSQPPQEEAKVAEPVTSAFQD